MLICQAALRYLVVVLVACSASTAFAQQADLNLIDQQIEAGEFGPAGESIATINDPAARDRFWSRLAAAQAASGARVAAFASGSNIEDDLAYADTLQTIADHSLGGRGGGTQADFDSLIELITTTVAPDTWDEVGGPGAIDGFEGGVFVDPVGLMRRVEQRPSGELARLRAAAATKAANEQWRVPSEFRKISLSRLERAVMAAHAVGHPPSESMQYLAGIDRITHVMVYPDTGDVVIAGPAGDYTFDNEGRRVSVTSGRPLARLDDLIVTLRNAVTEKSRFGCSITPRQQQLAATKAFLKQSSTTPLKPGTRDRWLADLRGTLGQQDITVYGIDSRTHAGRVMIEADYRMKLVGMGLEEGVIGVESYLASIPKPANGEPPPPMDVLRWWFTLNYDRLLTTKNRDAFELSGKGVQVKSENELLSDLGERIHTGGSDDLNRQFAHSFTRQIDALEAKYPIYAELRNVFDMAMISAVIVREDLPEQAGWTPTHFGPKGAFEAELGPAPKTVETVINHRMIGQKHIVAGVSGGVRVDVPTWLTEKDRYKVDEYGLVSSAHGNSRRADGLAREVWWWD